MRELYFKGMYIIFGFSSCHWIARVAFWGNTGFRFAEGKLRYRSIQIGQDRFPIALKIVEMPCQDGDRDLRVHAFILMDDDVPEFRHPFHDRVQARIDNGILQPLR